MPTHAESDERQPHGQPGQEPALEWLVRFRGLPLTVCYIDGRRWRLACDAAYLIHGGRFAGSVSTVRAGFIYDWASIPRCFWAIFPAAGDGSNRYGIAALWHDWAYEHGQIAGQPCERRDADDLFYEIMLYVGVRPRLARLMWWAVRVGGWRGWNTRRRIEKAATKGDT